MCIYPNDSKKTSFRRYNTYQPSTLVSQILCPIGIPTGGGLRGDASDVKNLQVGRTKRRETKRDRTISTLSSNSRGLSETPVRLLYCVIATSVPSHKILLILHQYQGLRDRPCHISYVSTRAYNDSGLRAYRLFPRVIPGKRFAAPHAFIVLPRVFFTTRDVDRHTGAFIRDTGHLARTPKTNWYWFQHPTVDW